MEEKEKLPATVRYNNDKGNKKFLNTIFRYYNNKNNAVKLTDK